MTLLMMALSPLAMGGTWVLQWATRTATTLIQSAYAKAGGIVTESLGSIRTVAALQGEEVTLRK
jgi:ABC-type bacteriocin/lantibiotic exporter with double-glycine peptidase domain